MGKKKRYKGINEATMQLPTITRTSCEKHYRLGQDLINDNRTDIENIDAKKVYVDTLPVILPVNHKRNLKKLVNKFGKEVIGVYCEANKK